MAASDDPTVPRWWIVLFLVLALGLAAAGVLAAGGSLLGGVVVPP
jgi:predicted secreted protein